MKKEIFTIFTGFAFSAALVTITTTQSSVTLSAADRIGVRAVHDVVGQGSHGPVVAEGGATVWKTRNGMSFKLSMPTPKPGAYEYPAGGVEYSPEAGDPEVFTLWAFVFNDSASEDWDGAFAVEVHAATGRNLELNGYITRDTEPFSGEKLENPTRAEVHLALVPHGAMDSEAISGAQDSLPGERHTWWFAICR